MLETLQKIMMFMCLCNDPIYFIELDEPIDNDKCHKQQESLQKQVHAGSFIVSNSESLRIDKYIYKNADTWIN